MIFSAQLRTAPDRHTVTLRAGEHRHHLAIEPRPGGGSSVSGGELLFLALATCFCNDLYREAARRGISIQGLEVDVSGSFAAEGEPATRIRYAVHAQSDAPEAELLDLLRAVDAVAEVQNTLRRSTQVVLTSCQGGTAAMTDTTFA